MKQKKFNVGDKVFAKVKGYPAWPAVVTHINKSTYGVVFYGTSEVAACKPQDLFYYLRHREKFIKNQKRKEYLDAVEEIDIAIAQNGGKDGSTEDVDVSNSDLSNSMEETENKKRDSDKIEGEEMPSDSKRQKSIQGSTADSMETSQNLESSPETSNISTNDKSSGLRLTISDIKIITSDYLQTVLSYAKHVRKNPEIFKKLPEEIRTKHPNELVVVKTKSGQLVGIKYNRDEHITSDSEYNRALYDEAEATTLLSMKDMLENGQCLPEEDPTLFETNLDITDLQIQESIELALIESKKLKLDWLKIENKLAELDTEIKKLLGLHKANPEMAEKLLSQILDLKIEPLMLLKHPNVFDMAKRLRKYVGNVHEWNYSDDDRIKFEGLAEKVREKADAIYKRFIEIFKYKGVQDPWDYYLEQVGRFKEQVADMAECTVFALTAPPSSRATFFDTIEDQPELNEMVEKLGKNKTISTTHLKI